MLRAWIGGSGACLCRQGDTRGRITSHQQQICTNEATTTTTVEEQRGTKHVCRPHPHTGPSFACYMHVDSVKHRQGGQPAAVQDRTGLGLDRQGRHTQETEATHTSHGTTALELCNSTAAASVQAKTQPAHTAAAVSHTAQGFEGEAGLGCQQSQLMVMLASGVKRL